MRTLRGQAGFSLISTLFILALVFVVVILTLKLAPLYFEYSGVVSSLDSLKDESGLGNKNQAVIRKRIQRLFEINDVRRVDLNKDVKISRRRNITTVEAKYEARASLIANLFLIIAFQHQVEL